jgi:predicted DCC family thiol-disulfide oxidoreductase YuxK
MMIWILLIRTSLPSRLFFAALINLLWSWWRRAGYACFRPNEKRVKQDAKNGENDQLAKHWHHP